MALFGHISNEEGKLYQENGIGAFIAVTDTKLDVASKLKNDMNIVNILTKSFKDDFQRFADSCEHRINKVSEHDRIWKLCIHKDSNYLNARHVFCCAGCCPLLK